jgi:hypothetical protein
MSRRGLQRLADVRFVEQIAAVVDDGGGALLGECVAEVSEARLRILKEALSELEPVWRLLDAESTAPACIA